MGDIVAFLLARIAEDEKSANEVAGSGARMGQAPEDFGKYVIDPVIGGFGGQSRNRNVATGLHLARFGDPARVLAECAAKRAIIDNLDRDDVGVGSEVDGWHDSTMDAVRLLAAVWSDHEDFLPEYRA